MKGDINFGVFVGTPRLIVVNEIKGKSGIKECEYGVNGRGIKVSSGRTAGRNKSQKKQEEMKKADESGRKM